MESLQAYYFHLQNRLATEIDALKDAVDGPPVSIIRLTYLFTSYFNHSWRHLYYKPT